MAKEFEIGGRPVGVDHAPYIIAEAGINHNGDAAVAKEMIRVAALAGVDAVKFQTFKTEEFLTDRSVPYTYRSQGEEITESMFDMFKRTELTDEEWRELKACCDECGVDFLSTPASTAGTEFLVEIGSVAIKVSSDELTNLPQLREYASFNLPLLVSCGMGSADEIQDMLEAVDSENHDICIFLCTSQYPTPPEDVNALKLLEMQELFPGVVVGLSDHTQGSTAAILSIGLGARVFEKHFTLDHDMPGPDQWFSSEPDELAEWVQGIRNAYMMLGSSSLQPTDTEMEMRDIARKSIVALRSIEKGEAFTLDNIGLRRPGTGLPPKAFESVLGKRAACDILPDSLIAEDDIA